MKLGYITKENPDDIKAYSGIHFFMQRALLKQFEHVEPLGPLDDFYKWIPKLKGKIYRIFDDKTYKYQYDLKLAKRASRKLEKRIAKKKPDVLFGSLVTPEVAFLDTDKPLFLTSDATFPLLHNLYESHSNLFDECIENARYLEKRAFKKAKKLVFPLHWIADSVMRDYGIPEEKIEVIPYGANIKEGLNKKSFEENLTRKMESKTCKLLFVGVRWDEKGGEIVLNVYRLLQKREMNVELYICGANPELPDNYEYENVYKFGFLDKSNPRDYNKMKQLYKSAHFFVFPTKAECVGISVLEAMAYGLPVLTTKVGGMPEIIENGKNGFINEKVDDAEFFADIIMTHWNCKNVYEKLCRNAYFRYRNKLNWEKWGYEIKNLLKKSNQSHLPIN